MSASSASFYTNALPEVQFFAAIVAILSGMMALAWYSYNFKHAVKKATAAAAETVIVIAKNAADQLMEDTAKNAEKIRLEALTAAAEIRLAALKATDAGKN